MKKIYRQRIESLTFEIDKLKRHDSRFSLIRLGSFFVFVTLTILVFQYSFWFGLASVYLSIFFFYKLVVHHRKIRMDLKKVQHQLNLSEAEIDTLKNNFAFFRPGDSYVRSKHPYSSDLDIFGHHSIFQMLNRCTSLPGETRLAEVLAKGLDANDIPRYQQAVLSIEPDLQWRQELYALGKMDLNYEEEYARFKIWLLNARIFRTAVWVQIGIPVFCLSLFILLIFYIPWHLALLAFIPTIFIAWKTRGTIDALHAGLDNNEKHLHAFSHVIGFLENSTYDNELLNEISNAFRSDTSTASESIKEVSYILSQLNLRYNFFGIILNLLTLWDLYWADRLEDWKEKNGLHFIQWITSLAEFELMNSLATFAFNSPEGTYPLLKQTGPISAKNLIHPLIDRKKCVPNDLELPIGGHIKIITGSNMGGKSTYLRTCGVNIVLARCGTKILGTHLELPFVSLITSMRTADDLNENVSSFYAELKRLKMVLEAVNENSNTLFLLDEILKGTNSNDRHKGSRALILQLLNKKGSGLISTHDLKLGEWAEGHPENLENLCFEVEVDEGQLVFDYKVRKGISESFNATLLMRDIGLEI